MTDRLRPTASTITDTQLDRLHDRLHAKDAFIRRLYDAWRSARRRARQRTAERDQHAALLTEALDWIHDGPLRDRICTALAGTPQPPAEPGVIAYRSTSSRMLRCLDHVPPPAARAADCIPVTAEDLDDGGICTHPDCGVDVLAQPAAWADTDTTETR